MKIAIASSGLGHVARGIEAWAEHTAEALAERGVDVTLFGAWDELPEDAPLMRKLIACRRRFDPETQKLINRIPGFMWRWGFKAPYGVEQYTFWLHLWKELKRGGYDILHVQDPRLAYWCRIFRKLGLIRTREILAHGTNEDAAFLSKFRWLQHLAPCRMEEVKNDLRSTKYELRGKEGTTRGVKNISQRRRDAEREQKKRVGADPLIGEPDELRFAKSRIRDTGKEERSANDELRKRDNADLRPSTYRPVTICSGDTEDWVAIPNFVDTDTFTPGSSGGVRQKLGIPDNAFVIGTVAMVEKRVKRIDYLIREFAEYSKRTSNENSLAEAHQSSFLWNYARHGRSQRKNDLGPSDLMTFDFHDPYLLIVGAKMGESDELVALANELAPGRVKFLFDRPSSEMPSIYRSMNLFVLTSLFEMMPVSVIEAMASGLPVIAHTLPVLEWMVGQGSTKYEVQGTTESIAIHAKAGLPSGAKRHKKHKSKMRNTKTQISRRGASVVVPVELEPSPRLRQTKCPTRELEEGKSVGADPLIGEPDDLREETCDLSTYRPLTNLSAGVCIDMSIDGELSDSLLTLTPECITQYSKNSRKRAVEMFSKDAVVQQYIDYYRQVISESRSKSESVKI